MTLTIRLASLAALSTAFVLGCDSPAGRDAYRASQYVGADQVVDAMSREVDVPNCPKGDDGLAGYRRGVNSTCLSEFGRRRLKQLDLTLAAAMNKGRARGMSKAEVLTSLNMYGKQADPESQAIAAAESKRVTEEIMARQRHAEHELGQSAAAQAAQMEQNAVENQARADAEEAVRQSEAEALDEAYADCSYEDGATKPCPRNSDQ